MQLRTYQIASGTKTSIPSASQGTFNITIAPGQTHEFPTQIDLHLNTYTYGLSCEVVGDPAVFTDPNPGNNTYTEHIEALGQVHMLSADLAVTDVFAQSLPSGDVYCRITNHGPDALQNATVGLNAKATIHTYNPNDPTTSAGSSSAITVASGSQQTQHLDVFPGPVLQVGFHAVPQHPVHLHQGVPDVHLRFARRMIQGQEHLLAGLAYPPELVPLTMLGFPCREVWSLQEKS